MDNIVFGIFVVLLALAMKSSANVPLYIGGFIDLNTTNGGWNSGGVYPAIELALQHINQDQSLLQGIKLELVIKDSRCSDAYAIKTLVEHITADHTVVMLIGPGCSIAAEPIAIAGKFWNLVQVAYAAGTPRLSDKTLFPLFYRVNAPETVANLAIVAMLKKFKWSRVAIVKEDVAVFNDVSEGLQLLLRRENISLIGANSFITNPDNVITDLKQKDARIIIVLTYEGKCRKLMCSAFRHGFYGKHIVWLLRGWYVEDWSKVVTDVTCSPQEVQSAHGNYIAFEEVILSTSTEKTINGLTPDQLNKLYLRQARNISYPINSYAAYGYDAMWVVALALNRTNTLLKESGLTLHNFTYDNKYIASIINESTAKTRFFGMSGEVAFLDNGDRISSMWIEQFQDDGEIRVGVFDATHGDTGVDRINVTGSFYWPEGSPPPSEPVTITEIVLIEMPLFVTMATIACAGIFLSTLFLILNIKNRQRTFIRMSSPYLNNFIIAGSIMCYTCVILFGVDVFLDESDHVIHSAICSFRLWLLSCGYTLAFGTMFIKTWRVYKIFTNHKLDKQLGRLHDRHLVCMLALMLSVDLLFLSVWQAVDGLKTEIRNVQTENGRNKITILMPVFLACTCTHKLIWLGCLYTYKGLLMIFGLFLAWETRNVSYPALNDSRYIGLSVYNVVIWVSISVPLGYTVVYDSVNAHFALVSSAINICTTSTLLLVFGPKLRSFSISPEHHPESTRASAKSNVVKQHPECPGCKCE
ncbi:gamma-aminobutyric acid type B receptor subunit 2 isoform X2 [Nematostella vectensis]|nr:gamma-aminobutyric acid type B receptor subunit 2 isoform X2 [Nematostella vectensis]XP_048582696.1 gamma-aminobutyric acid type B receptor subunit 2 isoform X2 [Nematostella vectensis]XP_048582697.1 gamma-aminobutyric acid type B receptor subunit 2 isoform X2 [Nematostella vectensis]